MVLLVLRFPSGFHCREFHAEIKRTWECTLCNLLLLLQSRLVLCAVTSVRGRGGGRRRRRHCTIAPVTRRVLAVFLQNNKSVRKFLLLCIFRYHAIHPKQPPVDAAFSDQVAAAAIDIIDISCTNHGIALHYVQRPNCGQSPPPWETRGFSFRLLDGLMGDLLPSSWMVLDRLATPPPPHPELGNSGESKSLWLSWHNFPGSLHPHRDTFVFIALLHSKCRRTATFAGL